MLCIFSGETLKFHYNNNVISLNCKKQNGKRKHNQFFYNKKSFIELKLWKKMYLKMFLKKQKKKAKKKKK